MADSKEHSLIRKAKQGDEGSMEALLLSCTKKAYSIAYRFLEDEENAMDAVQESYIKAFRNIGNFNEQSSFSTWIYRIVVNCCKDMLKKRKKEFEKNIISENDDYIKENISDTGPTPEEELIRKENRITITACLNRLEKEQREIIILRDIHQFSYSEIAEILGISEGTVKSRLNRGRNKFKEIYTKSLEMEQKT